MGLFDLLWKITVALFDGASGVVRWLTGNTVRFVFVLGIFVALPLSISFIGFLLSGTESSRGAAWREYFRAREEVISGREDADWLEELVLIGPQGDFAGDSLRNSTIPRLWALQFAADMELADGARLVYSSRDEAQERLSHAIELYERISRSSTDIGSLFHERVELGKSHAHEALLACSTDVNEFKGHYAAAMKSLDYLLANATNQSVTVNAQRRKQVLIKYGKEIWTEGDVSSSSFYSWLSNYLPPEMPLDPFPGNPSPPDLQPRPSPFPDPGELLPPAVIFSPTGDATDETSEGDSSEGPAPGEDDSSEGPAPGEEDSSEGPAPGEEDSSEGDSSGGVTPAGSDSSAKDE